MTRQEIKARAKELLFKGQDSPILATLLYLAISVGVSFVVSFVMGLITGVIGIAGAFGSEYSDSNASLAIGSLMSSILSTVASLLAGGIAYAVVVGYGRFNLDMVTTGKGKIESLWGEISRFAEILKLYLIITIKTALWSMLCIVPGIVASYRYSFAIYNFVSNPGMTANEAVELSKQQTNGMKMDLFVLDLSFIGWYLLGALTCGLGYVVVMPYHMLSRAMYYTQSCGIDNKMNDASDIIDVEYKTVESKRNDQEEIDFGFDSNEDSEDSSESNSNGTEKSDVFSDNYWDLG